MEDDDNMTLSKGSFKSPGRQSEHFSSPKPFEEDQPLTHNIHQTEKLEEEPLQAVSNMEEIPEQGDLETRLNEFESNASLKFSNELKYLREQLFLSMKKVRDQKTLYEAALADRARCIDGLEYELTKGDHEKEELRRKVNDLNFEHENVKKHFEKKLEDLNAKVVEYEREKLRAIMSQNEMTRLKMDHDLIKLRTDGLQAEVERLKKQNAHLLDENQNMQKIIIENRDITQNNQALMLNLGIPSYREQLDMTIHDFNSLGINLDTFNLDKHSVYELCHLLMRKVRDMSGRLKYFEDGNFEERLNKEIEEALRLREDIMALENLRDQLSGLNQELQAKNDELVQNQLQFERWNEVSVQKDIEIRQKEETIVKKDKIILELERLIDIYESQIYTKEHLKESEQMEEEVADGESKESVLKRYNKLKQEWILLMKDYKDLRQVIMEYQAKDPNNADKYEENFLNALIRENNHLKEINKIREEECKKYYEHAIEKVQQFKDITKNLLGWDIRIKDEIVEMRSLLSNKEEGVLVLKEVEEKKYVLLDVEDFAKDLFGNFPHLAELKEISYPLFFAYVSVLLKPELKELYFIL